MLDRSLFTTRADEVVDVHGGRLRELKGRTMEATWVAWDDAQDEWFPDEAVVLRVGSDNLEIVCSGMDQLALTWNAIDISEKPAWVTEWGSDAALSWRCDAVPELAATVGKTVVGVAILEYLFESQVVASREVPGDVGRQERTWLLNGLEFNLGGERLHVFNALDQNGIALGQEAQPGIRRIEL